MSEVQKKEVVEVVLGRMLSYSAVASAAGESEGELSGHQIGVFRTYCIIFAILELALLILAIHNLVKYICKAGQVWSLYVFYFFVLALFTVIFANLIIVAIFITPTRFHNVCYSMTTTEIIIGIVMHQCCLATFLLIIIMIYLVKENLKLYNVPIEQQKVIPLQIESNKKWVYVAAISIWVLMGTIRAATLFSSMSRNVRMMWQSIVTLGAHTMLLISFLTVMWQLQSIMKRFSSTIREYLDEGTRDTNRQMGIISTCFFVRICCEVISIVLWVTKGEGQACVDLIFNIFKWLSPIYFFTQIFPLGYILYTHVKVFRSGSLFDERNFGNSSSTDLQNQNRVGTRIVLDNTNLFSDVSRSSELQSSRQYRSENTYVRNTRVIDSQVGMPGSFIENHSKPIDGSVDSRSNLTYNNHQFSGELLMEDFEKLPRQTHIGQVLKKNIVGRLLTARISELEKLASSRQFLTTSEESDASSAVNKNESDALLQQSSGVFQNLSRKTQEMPLTMTPPSPYALIQSDKRTFIKKRPDSRNRGSINDDQHSSVPVVEREQNSQEVEVDNERCFSVDEFSRSGVSFQVPQKSPGSIMIPQSDLEDSRLNQN